MSILYTQWTERVKIQAIQALKRQKNTKNAKNTMKNAKIYRRCGVENTIFDIPLVLSVFFFLVNFSKFSCNRRRHWAREDFFLGRQPRVCGWRVSEKQKKKPRLMPGTCVYRYQKGIRPHVQCVVRACSTFLSCSDYQKRTSSRAQCVFFTFFFFQPHARPWCKGNLFFCFS